MAQCRAAEEAAANEPATENGDTEQEPEQAQGGGAPSLDELAAKGEVIANSDPQFEELRDLQAEGPARWGFDIGIAVAQDQTEWGPGKQRILDSLGDAEQEGYKVATSYSLDRNRNAQLVAIGMAIAEADAQVAEARQTDPDPLYWLGFDIATAMLATRH